VEVTGLLLQHMKEAGRYINRWRDHIVTKGKNRHQGSSPRVVTEIGDNVRYNQLKIMHIIYYNLNLSVTVESYLAYCYIYIVIVLK